MKVGDLVRMKNWADKRMVPPKGIITETKRPSGHRYERHTVLWDDGHLSEIPADILTKVRFDNNK